MLHPRTSGCYRTSSNSRPIPPIPARDPRPVQSGHRSKAARRRWLMLGQVGEAEGGRYGVKLHKITWLVLPGRISTPATLPGSLAANPEGHLTRKTKRLN